ncbi:chromate transporter [Bacillus tianshenii]|nr:chromate transporter [Bacillus tianshenii]
MNKYMQLVIGFARTGVTGYGGGPATIPLIEYEAVKKYGWMTEDEFGETLALANTLPGPIATKMAAYIGYKVSGAWGAVIAILSHIIPSLIGMVSLLGLLYSYRNSPIVSGMVTGVMPIIGIMLAGMAYKFIDKAKKGLGMSKMLMLAGVSFVVLELLKIHPGILIAVVLGSAFAIASYQKKKNEPVEDTNMKRKRESV